MFAFQCYSDIVTMFAFQCYSPESEPLDQYEGTVYPDSGGKCLQNSVTWISSPYTSEKGKQDRTQKVFANETGWEDMCGIFKEGGWGGVAFSRLLCTPPTPCPPPKKMLLV